MQSLHKNPLTTEQIEHYHCEGYVIVRGLIPAERCADVHALASKRELSGKDWTPAIFDHQQPDADAALHQLLVEPSVVDAVEALLSCSARVYYGMVAMVAPGGGRGLPWHQDNQYQHVLHHALNTFIAVSDIAPEQCTLWVAPRSHLSGVVASIDDKNFHGHKRCVSEPVNGMALPQLTAGDACIFNRNTIHRSLTNTTNTLRVAYAAQYMHEDGRVAATGQRDPSKMLANELAERWKKKRYKQIPEAS